MPTWTGLLDALAIARIANSLDKGTIPAIDSVRLEDLKNLGNINGLIGVDKSTRLDEEADDPLGKGEIKLGLGAPGVFNRRLAKISMQRAELRRTTMRICQCSECQRKRVEAASSDGPSEAL